MIPFNVLTGRVITLPVDNIDTDQIIPGRFLKTTAKSGLGAYLFADWRYDPAGVPRPGFALNRPGVPGASILLAGDNFGCGSSREHAPWALLDFGFRAIISTSFADIFGSNALKNGLLPVAVDREAHRQLLDLVTQEPAAEITIDLPAQVVVLPDGRRAQFPIDPFSKNCLLRGVDTLGYLLQQEAQIAAYERGHPARVNTGAAGDVA